MDKRSYKQWWSGNSLGTGGLGILVREKLSEKVVELQRRSDQVMTMVQAFREELVRVMCVYAPQSGKTIEASIL